MKATRHKASSKSLAIRPLAACLLAALATTLDGGVSASAQARDSVPIRPGSTLPVTSCADDGGAGTLRSVVAGAASGDIVDLSQLGCSTITLQDGQIEVNVDNLTLAGPGRDALTIDAHDASRILLHNGAGTLTVSGLTLTHGRADAAIPSNPAGREASGGCVMSTAATYGVITMTDSAVTECTAINGTDTGNAALGGGIYSKGPINLTNVIVSNNTASDIRATAGSGIAVGGGIRNNWDPITLTDCVVQGNRAEASYFARAGGVYSMENVVMTNTVVDGNFAGCDTSEVACSFADGGGVVALGYSANIETSLSRISNNTASAMGEVSGGGIALVGSAIARHITDTQISGNRALSVSGQAHGGGVYASGVTRAKRSTVSGNTADVGGGLFVYYGTLFLDDSTVSGNSAVNAGGIYNAHATGYYGFTGPLWINNSTITANAASGITATGGVGGGVVSTFQSSIRLQSSIVAGNATPNADPSKADLIDFTGVIVGASNLVGAAQGVALPADTIRDDPLLGPLQDNGGPTLTHALLPGSPAIDAGNNTSNLDFDQRGEGFARVVGAAADIGAFETQQLYVLPTLAKAFAPDTIGRHGVSTLTITLINDNDIAGILTADLVDALPAPVVVADPANAGTTCSGTVTADPGSASVVLGAGAEFPARGECTITVSVTSDSAGRFANTIPAGALQTDLGSNGSAANADLTVTNASPAAVADKYAAAQNTVLTVDAPGVLANDSDADGDTLTAALVVGPAHGSLSLNPDGSFVYTPASGFFGTDTFTYLASDGQASTAATVTITVKQGTDDTIFVDGFD